ncbi:MAG: type I restriction-modification system subunit M, partial [Cyanobacteria bacterium REEB65]|nr:type I restriction-modification system subunit M [Cyanobacteria bacterium REEB65]
MTLALLESHLWGAADILRGSIDSADYKHYIFGLLFFKRLCDVWEEEYEQRLRDFNDADLAADPDEHRFHIPAGHFWRDVRKHTTNIGEHLNNAFHAIEDANLRLQGVFQDVDFNNKERFPDATLERLLQHFERYRFRHEDVEADMLGNSYEYLIAKFADDAGKKGGEFYTPKMVVRLIVECLRPQEGMSVYDPTCGSGGMLLEAAHYLERQWQNPKTLHLYGQEKNLNTWAICQMNLFLHDIDDAFVMRGDTLRDPKHLAAEGSKALTTFDQVMANPPFSLSEWGHDEWKTGDKFGRDRYGCPPKSYGDLAFVQHMVASLKQDGMAGVVLPHGILFRGGAEGKIREGLLKDDLVEAVIGIAPNLFYGTGIPACVLI